ncbi:uncharacterized protein [Montipora foliosa]
MSCFVSCAKTPTDDESPMPENEDVKTEEMTQPAGRVFVDLTDKTDVMWMKMALMAACRAEITEHAAGKPSVGCVIRRSRSKGPPAVLAIGWNGFLPETTEDQLKEIKRRVFKSDKKKHNALTNELGLHAEANALQYCSESPEMATVYVTHVPCYSCAKQLVARKVGRVFYLYWMDGADSTVKLFEMFNITCIAFAKRKEVLEDFQDDFVVKRGILRGGTKDKMPENCPFFVDSRDLDKDESSDEESESPGYQDD